MARNWTLTRTEAECLVDVIEASGEQHAVSLAAELRELFGMCSMQREREFRAQLAAQQAAKPPASAE
jgi:hypothetical protein